MKAIVSVENRWGIGLAGELFCKLPEDMKRFKNITTGNVVIMGRRTFDSLPNKEPLKDRVNIVLTRYTQLQPESTDNLLFYDSIYHLLSDLKFYSNKEIYIIGGQEIYGQFLPFCEEALVTRINASFCIDRFFPNLGIAKNWELTHLSSVHHHQAANDIGKIYFTYSTYTNNNVKELT